MHKASSAAEVAQLNQEHDHISHQTKAIADSSWHAQEREKQQLRDQLQMSREAQEAERKRNLELLKEFEGERQADLQEIENRQ